MRLKLTFSNFKAREPKATKPILPFTLTIGALVESDRLLFRITIPGCIYAPLDEGSDGLPGKFQRPTYYMAHGQKVTPGVLFEPESFTTLIERALRKEERIDTWKRRLIAIMSRDPRMLTARQKKALDRIMGS